MEKQCAYCGKVFRSSHKGARFCCREHSVLNQKGKLRKERPTLICQYCGKEFQEYPSQIKKGGGKYCSKKCSNNAKIGIHVHTEESKRRIGAYHKTKVFTEEYRRKLSDAAKIIMNTPERKAHQAKLASERFKGKPGIWAGKKIPPDVIEARIAPRRGKPCSTSHKENISKSNKGKPKSEKHILKEIESKIGGFWCGNVRYNGVQYCELWRDVNPRVHAFFGNNCVECGTPTNGKSHAGHHIFYVKRACCWHSEDGIYYTNLNAPDHPTKDYCIGENPNYFVILCNKCHSKTNGNYENRKKWADHFKQLIDTKYGGKCYLTKNEYAAYMSNNI